MPPVSRSFPLPPYLPPLRIVEQLDSKTQLTKYADFVSSANIRFHACIIMIEKIFLTFESHLDLSFLIQLAEHAERFDDMRKYMKEVVQIKKQLTVEERSYLSVAYKNAIG